MSTDIERFQNACENGDLENVTKLFDDVNDNMNMLEMRNSATKNGHLNILQFLHKKGVDINELYCADNPLMIAAARGWVDIVDYLLLQPEIDINLQTYDYGWTALMFAVFHSKTDVVDRLLQNENCQINSEKYDGNTAIFLATQSGVLEIVDKLIINGSNIWHVNKYGKTLLHCAAISRNLKVLERVLSLGLDVNQQDYNGWTPLMYSVFYNNNKIVEILLEHGADTTIRDNGGKIAIDCAENEEIKNLLRK